MTPRNKKKILFICLRNVLKSKKVNPIDNNICLSIDSTFSHHKHVKQINYKSKTEKKKVF